MAIDSGIPKLATILIAGLVDSINPCAIGVFILLISTILVARKKENMLIFGLAYIFAIFLTYVLLGLGLVAFLSIIPLLVAQYITLSAGLLVIFLGIIEVKDFFWYGHGFSLSIPYEFVHKIKDKMKKLSFLGIILIGVFVAAVELPCTGGPYLAVTIILAQNFNFTAFLLLVLYNIIFVLPLVIILLLVIFGMHVQQVQEWKQKNRPYMRLFIGLLLILLGWLLILITNGTINLN